MKDKGNQTVAAIVVTYNRKELLNESLRVLLQQTRPLDSIIIVDNASTDGTPKFMKENGYLDNQKIDYLRLPQNTGGAGGFHEGVKRGYSKGFDWLWLMDDDIEPAENCLENLLKEGNTDDSVLIVSPIKLYREGFIGGATLYQDLKNPFRRSGKYFRVDLPGADIKELPKVIESLPDIIEVFDVPFEGPLMRREAVETAGLPKKDFFISLDDVEYCLRVRKHGKLLLSTNALLFRKLPDTAFSKAKKYYYKRNSVFIDKTYGENALVRNFRPLMYFLVPFVKGLVKFNAEEISIAYRSYIDGCLGKFGVRDF